MDEKFWAFIGAQVWAPGTGDWGYDGPEEPIYGPHVTEARSREGHHATVERITSPEHPRGWPVAVCECGWRDFPTNYYEHLDRVSPLVLVYR